MSVAALPQSVVFGPAYGVVLDGDAGPVKEGIGEAFIDSQPTHDDLCLAGLFGDRRDPGQTAQG